MKKFLQIVVITPLIILFTTRSPGAQYRPLHLSSSSRSVNARRRSIIPYVPSPPQELDRNHAARFVLIHVPPAPFYPWQTPQLRQLEHEIIQHVFQPGLIVSSSCFCSTASTWTTVPRLDLGTKSGLDMEIGASFGSESSDDESRMMSYRWMTMRHGRCSMMKSYRYFFATSHGACMQYRHL